MSSPDRLFEMKKTPGLNIKFKRVFCLRSQNRKTLIERRAGSRERQRPKEMTRMLPANIRPFVPIEIIQWDFLSLIFIPRLEYTYIYNQKTTRERERKIEKGRRTRKFQTMARVVPSNPQRMLCLTAKARNERRPERLPLEIEHIHTHALH